MGLGSIPVRAIHAARAVGGAVQDLLFPPRCLLCLEGGDSTPSPFCTVCAEAIAEERARPACPTCGADVAPHEVRLGRCSTCRGRSMKIMGTSRVGPYRSALGQLFRAYKFHDREELGHLLGDWLVEAVEKAGWLDRVEAVTSVPTHWLRRLDRKFHAAEVLAGHLSKRLERPQVPLLRRIRAGRHQLGLSYTQRAANVRGAFALAPGFELRKARLLLVDDVRTTGATLDECAKLLRRHGCSEVYVAVVLHAGHTSANDQILSTV
jgi:ComF family protein